MGRITKFEQKAVERIEIEKIEKAYNNKKIILYQDDLEKIIGQTLDVPGSYFNHGGGGKYWNSIGNEARVFYYYEGCLEILRIMHASDEIFQSIDRYFEVFKEEKKITASTDNLDEIFNSMYLQLNDIMKKKVMIFMKQLLNEKQDVEIAYNNIVQIEVC